MHICRASSFHTLNINTVHSNEPLLSHFIESFIQKEFRKAILQNTFVLSTHGPVFACRRKTSLELFFFGNLEGKMDPYWDLKAAPRQSWILPSVSSSLIFSLPWVSWALACCQTDNSTTWRFEQYINDMAKYNSMRLMLHIYRRISQVINNH